MPELPDVEVFRKEVAEDTIGEVITSITVGTPKMIKFIGLRELGTSLTRQKIIGTKRHGKNLFLKFKNDHYLRLHFGMTGYITIEDDNGDLPRHTCLALHFKSGKRLVFVDPRKFGAVEYIDQFSDFLNQAHIGPDVETLGLQEFSNLLRNKRSQIKPLLMDQSLMSGLGNVYTDEVLFQAKVHPETHIDKLDHKIISAIYRKIKSVIREAIKDHAERDEMPARFLIHHRHAGDKCPQCRKGHIEMKAVGGRSTYFCNYCQKLPS